MSRAFLGYLRGSDEDNFWRFSKIKNLDARNSKQKNKSGVLFVPLSISKEGHLFDILLRYEYRPTTNLALFFTLR